MYGIHENNYYTDHEGHANINHLCWPSFMYVYETASVTEYALYLYKRE